MKIRYFLLFIIIISLEWLVGATIIKPAISKEGMRQWEYRETHDEDGRLLTERWSVSHPNEVCQTLYCSKRYE